MSAMDADKGIMYGTILRKLCTRVAITTLLMLPSAPASHAFMCKDWEDLLRVKMLTASFARTPFPLQQRSTRNSMDVHVKAYGLAYAMFGVDANQAVAITQLTAREVATLRQTARESLQRRRA
jgi:hypothetical protein